MREKETEDVCPLISLYYPLFETVNLTAQINLSTLQETVMDREAQHAAVHGVIKSLDDLVTEKQLHRVLKGKFSLCSSNTKPCSLRNTVSKKKKKKTRTHCNSFKSQGSDDENAFVLMPKIFKSNVKSIFRVVS